MSIDAEPAAPAPGVGDDDEGRAGRGLFYGTLAAMLVAVAFVVVILVAIATGGPSKPKGFDYVVIVPSGTSAKVAAGEPLNLMPHDVRLRVGDRIIVENRDVAVQQVGPITVRPGERSVYEFDAPGRYVGACTVGGGGEIAITVT